MVAAVLPPPATNLSAHTAVLEANAAGGLDVIEVDCRDVNVGFEYMDWYVRSFKPDVVVYEGFDLWTAAADLTPVELIALMRWEWRRAPWKLVQQNPSERSVITPERLKRWGLWTPGKKDAMSAMQHLITYLRKNNG